MTMLSKSKILSGRQCEKRLWLEVNRPELAEAPAGVEHRFSAGEEVNEVARALHEGGHLIGFDAGISGALAETERVMKASPEATLFEATFAHGGVVVRVDVLRKGAPKSLGFVLTEVKSATKVKAPYYPDCATQAWVLEGCGLPVERVELARIDTAFVYGGDGDYRGLLFYEDITADIAGMKKQVPSWVSRFKTVLKEGEPDIATGAHCQKPYACPFIAHCSGGANPGAEYPVSCLPRGAKVAGELEAEGIADIRDIPAGRLRSAKHEWVRKVTVAGQAELKPAAKESVDAGAYPRYYVDFETAQFAVPIWKDTRPYQFIPFQWSCHVEHESGEVTHAEFLHVVADAADPAEPPLRAFTESLLTALGTSGAIFVYGPFEKTRLNELAECFPELHEDIKLVINRLVDLLPIARENYYHPDMRGSWSLKSVLPTVAAHLDYGGLGEVQDGGAAGGAYLEMIHPDTAPQRARELAADLRAYCKRDTEALVEVVKFFSTAKPS